LTCTVPELLDVLRKHRAALCLSDIRSRPHPADLAEKVNVLTTGYLYARLIGDRSAMERRSKTLGTLPVRRNVEDEPRRAAGTGGPGVLRCPASRRTP